MEPRLNAASSLWAKKSARCDLQWCTSL